MYTIALTHYYSKLRGVKFYSVRTRVSLEDLNLTCAYLQLLRHQLPCFDTVEDGLGEVEGMELLARFYGCEPIVTKKTLKVDGVIDFYDNWKYYAIQERNKSAINQLARPGAKLAIVDEMLKDAVQKIDHYPTPAQLDVIKKLGAISSGVSVGADWELQTLSGNIYTGRIVASSEPDIL